MMKHSNNCVSCNDQIVDEIIKLTNKQFGVPLCRTCQVQFHPRLIKSAHNANRLFFALRARNIIATLAYDDGQKTIDICVEKSKLYIEVDGEQHNTNAKQAMSDLMRTFYACKDGYFTLRIPNSLVKKQLKEATTFIIYIIDALDQRNNETMAPRS